MTDFDRLLLVDDGRPTGTVRLVPADGFDDALAGLPAPARATAEAAGFRGRADTAVFVPDGSHGLLLVGLGEERAPGRWTLAAAAERAPEGDWRLDGPVPAHALHGWLLAQHRFIRYRRPADTRGPRRLLVGDPASLAPAIAAARADAEVRDLVDTPAEDLGPGELEERARALAEASGGRVEVIAGQALVEGNYPAIHAVGRASPRRPRLILMHWGEAGRPHVALVGKGVCFDTGGLNIKGGASMALMKKDMGGAAHALALAALVIADRLPVRLTLAVAAVDNAIAGNAIRPGDVIATRKGLTIEIGNTDAEGRLVLADALARVAEDRPDLILDFATLTGAARVALGPDLPALLANDDALADALLAAGRTVDDPLWRLPLWQPYRRLFRSTIADMGNTPENGFAGAIAGGLFLERFVPASTPWAHIDLYAWSPAARPGRPKGGAAMSLHACRAMLKARFA